MTSHDRAATATQAMAAASATIDHGEFDAANALLLAALRGLGDDAPPADWVDDTGQKLALAEAEARSGRLAVAANLRRGALASRLAMLEGPHAPR